ncbi:MAG: hypothetical protein JKY15_03075 [Deltaproteobacteria bacterium]|nr:hypothetical protein [Deltaproteobacteria bacterium]
MTCFRYIAVLVCACSGLLADPGEPSRALVINDRLFIVAPGTSMNQPGIHIVTFSGGLIPNQAVLLIMRRLLGELGRFELVNTGTETTTLMILAFLFITNTREALDNENRAILRLPSVLALLQSLHQEEPELVARLSDDGLGTLMGWEIDRANHFIDNMREQNMTHMVSEIHRIREMHTPLTALRNQAREQAQVADAGGGASARASNASTANANAAAAAANLGGAPHMPGLGGASE